MKSIYASQCLPADCRYCLYVLAWLCVLGGSQLLTKQQLAAQPAESQSLVAQNVGRPTVEWVASLGGQTSLNERDELVSVSLRHAWLTDSDLKRLATHPSLTHIDLAYTKVTDEGLEQLKPLTNVRELNLYFAEYVTDTGLAHLKRWHQLERLNVRGTKVTSTLFEQIVGMQKLRFLDVGFSRVNDDLFERLSELPELEHLFVGGNKMSGAAFPLLKLVPSLRELGLGGQQRTDSGLWGVAINDANAAELASLTALTRLDVSSTTLGDRGLIQLSKLTNLQFLDLSRTKVSAKGLAAIAEMPELTHLKLVGVEKIDDQCIATFNSLPKLKLLELQETKVTAAGLLQLSNPALKRVYTSNQDLTDEQRQRLAVQFPESVFP